MLDTKPKTDLSNLTVHFQPPAAGSAPSSPLQNRAGLQTALTMSPPALPATPNANIQPPSALQASPGLKPPAWPSQPRVITATNLHDLSTVRLKQVQHHIDHGTGEMAILRHELGNCVRDFLLVRDSRKLHLTLVIMLKLGHRCERGGDKAAAISLYMEASGLLPGQDQSPEAKRIRGLALQRAGKLEGGTSGLAKLRRSLEFLQETPDRAWTYIAIGHLLTDQEPSKALSAYTLAIAAFENVGDVLNQAKAVVHWASVARGTHSDACIVSRLQAAIEVFQFKEPDYEAHAQLQLAKTLDAGKDCYGAWNAYINGLNIARSRHSTLESVFVTALDTLANQRFWLHGLPKVKPIAFASCPPGLIC